MLFFLIYRFWFRFKSSIKHRAVPVHCIIDCVLCVTQLLSLNTGSGFGLSLVLNIEQYQYMTGPQDEAGIKVLLHDAREIPLVKDLGFAIAPGTHTLVAVQKQVVCESLILVVLLLIWFYTRISKK